MQIGSGRGRSALVGAIRPLTGLLLALSVLAWVGSAVAESDLGTQTGTVPVSKPRVLAQYPHDPRAFTQGLTFAGGALYEGTGWYGESNLREVDLTSGTPLRQVMLPADQFGEGIAAADDRIVQLTWRSHVGYIWDRATFTLLGTFGYPTEGWGLTYDGARFILSDGSDVLRLLDPFTLTEIGQVAVRENGRPVTLLNELEVVDGRVYANVWQTDRIAIIDPASGEVQEWLDLSDINPMPRGARDEVLNGIAFDPDSRRLYITGKRWPVLFEIEIPETGAPAGA